MAESASGSQFIHDGNHGLEANVTIQGNRQAARWRRPRTPTLLLATALYVAGAGSAVGQERADAVRIDGTVIDAVTGAPVARAVVRVEGFGHRETDGNGTFVYEALPLGSHPMVVARAGYATLYGDLTVLRPGDLVIRLERREAESGGRTLLTGKVVDASRDAGIPDVVVRIEEAGAASVTDPDGRFRFEDLPPGTYRLSVERLGYTSRAHEVELVAGEALESRIVLSADPVPIEDIVVDVEARNLALAQAGFYERRDRGLGLFVTREEIERRRPMVTTDVLRSLPGVRVTQTSRFGSTAQAVVLRGGTRTEARGPDGCGPEIWLDQVRLTREEGGGPVPLDRYVVPEEIEALEIYRTPAEVPAQYSTRESSCGVIVVWTRFGRPRG